MELEGEETGIIQILQLGCGEKIKRAVGFQALVELGMMADQYQVETVQGVVEDTLVSQLSLDSCASILSVSYGSGLERPKKCASRALALSEFDTSSMSAGFMELGEGLLEMMMIFIASAKNGSLSHVCSG